MELFLALAVLAGLGAVAAATWWFSAEQQARRLLAATPVTKIVDLRPGQRVRLVGRVLVREGALASPLTRSRCAAYRILIEEHHGKNSWRTVVDDTVSEPFLLDDGTGTCFVDPRGAALHLAVDDRGETGTFDNPSEAEAAVYEAYGVSSTSMLGLNRHLRIREAKLEDGEAATLLGAVEVEEVDGAPSLALVPDPEHGLVVTDHAALAQG